MLLVVLAWVNRFTRHQYKHRCWCYQRLLLVCLFVCIKPVTGNSQAWEHPEQRAVPEPTAVVFTNMISHVATQICPSPHTQDAWSSPRKYRHRERPVLSPGGASTDWGLVVRPPQQKGAVALGVSDWAAAPHTVCQNHRAPGPQNQHGWTSSNHRWFIIRLKIFLIELDSPRGNNSNPTLTSVV